MSEESSIRHTHRLPKRRFPTKSNRTYYAGRQLCPTDGCQARVYRLYPCCGAASVDRYRCRQVPIICPAAKQEAGRANCKPLDIETRTRRRAHRIGLQSAHPTPGSRFADPAFSAACCPHITPRLLSTRFDGEDTETEISLFVAGMAPVKDPHFLPEIWALFSLGSLWVVMRFAVRIRTFGIFGLGVDDGFAFIAVFCWAVIIAGINCTVCPGTKSLCLRRRHLVYHPAFLTLLTPSPADRHLLHSNQHRLQARRSVGLDPRTDQGGRVGKQVLHHHALRVVRTDASASRCRTPTNLVAASSWCSASKPS
jgi:hypothetical protein